MERRVEACENSRIACTRVRDEVAEPHPRGRLDREREQRERVLPEHVRVVRPADLEPVVLAQLHQLHEAGGGRVGQDGDAEAEGHRVSPVLSFEGVVSRAPRPSCVQPRAVCLYDAAATCVIALSASRSRAATDSSRCSSRVSSSFVCDRPAEALHEHHHRRDARSRHLRGVVERTRRQPVRRSLPPRGSLRRRGRSASRRRGSARCSRSAPRRPRGPPRRRTARASSCALREHRGELRRRRGAAGRAAAPRSRRPR